MASAYTSMCNVQNYQVTRLHKLFHFQALLDLHGGQGSQNGFDNSGKRGQIHFQDDDNAKEAVYVLGQMALLLKSWIDEGSIKAETIYGMELLNEPAAAWTPDLWEVIRDYFNYAGHDQIRQVFPAEMSNLSVVVQTAFKSYNDYDDYMQGSVSKLFKKHYSK